MRAWPRALETKPARFFSGFEPEEPQRSQHSSYYVGKDVSHLRGSSRYIGLVPFVAESVQCGKKDGAQKDTGSGKSPPALAYGPRP